MQEKRKIMANYSDRKQNSGWLNTTPWRGLNANEQELSGVMEICNLTVVIVKLFTLIKTQTAHLKWLNFIIRKLHLNKASSQGYGFSSTHVWMGEVDYKESWAPQNWWCFWTVVLEKTLEGPLDCKEIQPVHPKNESWVFIWRTDVEAETPILWPPNVKSWLIWKDPDAGKDWGQEEKGMTEDEMAGWNHRLDGHGFG